MFLCPGIEQYIARTRIEAVSSIAGTVRRQDSDIRHPADIDDDPVLDGMPEQYLVPYMDEIGLKPEKIRYVINSHADFDHTAGNASVRELCPQAVFMCHDLDRHMVEDIEAMIRLRYSE